jgi:hypothetical protein
MSEENAVESDKPQQNQGSEPLQDPGTPADKPAESPAAVAHDPEPAMDLDDLLDAVAPRSRGPRAALTLTPLVLQVVYGTASHQCTKVELASIFGVSRPTLDRFFADNPEVQDAWERGRGAGKLSLRRLLWKQAQAEPATARFLATDQRWLKMNPKPDAVPVQNLIVMSDDDRVRKILELQQKVRSLPSPDAIIDAETVETEHGKRR